jgi:uncharacterized small protein (DUF1192 family)
MYYRLATIGAAILALALGGCASMSSEECAASDWTAIGYEDGSRGYTSDRFGTHRKACAKHGYTADFGAYQQGREQGLVEFCQPSRGFALGANGGQYYGVCAANGEAEFVDAYRAGQQLYTLRSYVNSANSQIYARESELEEIRNLMRAKEAQIINPATTNEERVLLLVDLKELSERTGELEAEIDILIADRARYEADLQHYEQTVAAYGF